MSTVRDDAGIAPAQSTSDDERGGERESRNDESKTTGRLPGQTLEEPEEEGEDEHSLIPTDISFRGYKDYDPDIQEDSDLASSPAFGRPSSADGSLSIPDDTPSIQVIRISSVSSNGADLNRIPKHLLLADVPSYLHMVEVLHRPCAHSIDVFKHASLPLL